MNRNAVLAGRFLALGLLAVLALPACGGGTGSGGSSNSGLLWNSNGGVGTGGSPTPGGTFWEDPNSGLGGGTIGALIPSSDDITYSMPTVYIAGNNHPLSTSTSATTIRQAEDLLMQALNGYRSQQLNGGLGGLGGLGGGNGGIGTVPQNAFLIGNDGLTRNARANCKHVSVYHPGPLGAGNAEGDAVNGGGVAPAGRLAKTKITVSGVQELVVSGQGYSDYNAAAAYFIGNFGQVIADTKWTHIGAGYWTGGSEQYYWSVILATGPKP
jgi:hypothetical protein